jgi:ribonuclease P protein component
MRKSVASLTLEVCPTPENQAKPAVLRVGVTASRKMGGAVERNRAKRRLRAAARAVLPLSGVMGNDYVLVARRDTLTKAFDGLVADLARAVRAVHAGAEGRRTPHPASGDRT